MARSADMRIDESAVWRRLDRVMDPELDDPVSDMGFIEKVEVHDGRRVVIDFRLPTYWCSPNFAFLMAEGIHREVSALPGVGPVEVRLHDHLFGAELNQGLAEGRPFAEIFAGLAQGGSLDEVRRTFDRKAFQRRQEPVLLDLRRQGHDDAMIVEMTLRDFDAAKFESDEAKRRAPLYREMLLALGLARDPGDLAFRALDGAPLEAAALTEHLATLRQVRINMEFNGATCRALMATRYKELKRDGGQRKLVETWPEHRLAPAAATP